MKSGPLDPDEFDVVKTHTTVASRAVRNLRSLQAGADRFAIITSAATVSGIPIGTAMRFRSSRDPHIVDVYDA